MRRLKVLLFFAILLLLTTGTVNAEAMKKYLFYENFNHISDGELPDGLSFTIKNGSLPTVKKTTVSSGDYAMKFSTDGMGDKITGLAIQLSESVVGKGYNGAEDHSDRITIEYDLKNEHGAFGLSWLTSEEVAAGVMTYPWQKKPLMLTWNGTQMWPIRTNENGAWAGANNPHSYADAGMISGNTTFSSFGKWIHVTMILDGEAIETEYRDRFMYAEISWYEKDNPETVYRAYYSGNNGRGMFIENSGGSYVTSLGGFRQKDIASIVLPVFYPYQNRGIPTMEIDNLEVYLMSEKVQPPVVENVSFGQLNDGGLKINVNFSERMRGHVIDKIMLLRDDEEIAISPKLSVDGKFCSIENAVSEAGAYKVIVESGSIAYSGGIMTEKFSFEFECDVGADGKVNLVPIVLGAEAELLDGSTTTVFNDISPYIKRFTIKFANPMAENLADYITVSGNLNWKGEVSESKTEYIIKFYNVAPNAKYTVTISSGTPSLAGIGTKEDKSFSIETKNDVGVAYTPVSILVGDAEITGLPPAGTECKLSSEIMKTDTKTEKAIIMVCQYRLTADGYEELVEVKFAPLLVESGVGRDEKELNFTVKTETNLIKAYLQEFPSHKIIERAVYE